MQIHITKAALDLTACSPAQWPWPRPIKTPPQPQPQILCDIIWELTGSQQAPVSSVTCYPPVNWSPFNILKWFCINNSRSTDGVGHHLDLTLTITWPDMKAHSRSHSVRFEVSASAENQTGASNCAAIPECTFYFCSPTFILPQRKEMSPAPLIKWP